MADGDVDPKAVVAQLAGVDCASADRDTVGSALTSLGRLRAWCDALEVRLARRLEQVSSFPEKVLGDAARSSLRAGERVVQRQRVGEQAPAFERALASGRVTAGHVDALGRVLRRLGPAQRTELLAREDGSSTRPRSRRSRTTPATCNGL